MQTRRIDIGNAGNVKIFSYDSATAAKDFVFAAVRCLTIHLTEYSKENKINTLPLA